MYKKILISLLFLSLFANSQEKNNDTTYFKIGKTKFIVINDKDSLNKKDTVKFSGHFSGLSLGINFFKFGEANNNYSKITQKDLSLNLPRSWEVNLDPFQWSFNLYKQHFGLVTGLGFKFNNYLFIENRKISIKYDNLISSPDSINNIYKTKMMISKIRIPLMFEWQNKVGRLNKTIYFSAGGFVSYNISSHIKYNFNNDGKKIKEKKENTYYLNPLQYGLMMRFGFGSLDIYAEYNLSEMFTNGKALPINQFSVGIVLINL